MRSLSFARSPFRIAFPSIQAALLIVLAFPACKKGLSPEEKITNALQAQYESVFADLKIEDQAAFEADQQRVRDVHAIARLADAYNQKAGHYPLVTPEGSMKNVIMIAGKEARQKTDVTYEDFVADLKKVLGEDITVPTDPAPGDNGAFSYSYSAYGQGYTTAAMLYHHTPFSEEILSHSCQYRVGSAENTQLPILQFSKLVDGTSTVVAKPYKRGR